MNIDKELDVVFQKADEVFAKANKLFEHVLNSTPADKSAPVGEVHTDHVQFRATSFHERGKLFWRFLKMAVAVLFKGVAHLKFKSRTK